jgi:hypothetical protein
LVVRTGVVFVAIAAAGPVYAQSSTATHPAATEEALKRAQDAWDNGDFDLAPGLYQKAIAAGGLSRAEVVDAYARTGAALAVVGKRRAALAALREAALLDPAFTVPPEAGKKAITLAQRARKEQQRIGSLGVSAQVPDQVSSGEPFSVDVTIAPVHPIVQSVFLQVRDKLAGRTFEQESAPGAHLHFEVPTRMTLPDASLVVRVEARDSHGNELLSDERHVHVSHPIAAPAPVPPPLRPIARTMPEQDRPARRTKREEGGGGFWSSPWPYILGGTALAAGGAAVYLTTRPTADVNIGAARVEIH